LGKVRRNSGTVAQRLQSECLSVSLLVQLPSRQRVGKKLSLFLTVGFSAHLEIGMSFLFLCAGDKQMSRRLLRVPQVLILIVLCFALIGPAIPRPSFAQSAPPPLRIVTSFKIDSMDVIDDGFWMPEFGVAELLMQFRQDGKYYPWVLESLTQPDD